MPSGLTMAQVDTVQPRFWPSALAFSSAGAAPFYFREVHVVTQHEFWLGWSAAGWLESAYSLGIYFAYFFVAIVALGGLLRLASRRAIGADVSGAISAVVAVLLLGGFYYFVADESTRSPGIEAWILPIPFIAMAALIQIRRGVSPAYSLWVILAAMVGSCVLMQVRAMATHPFMDDDPSLRWPFYWLAFVAVAGFGLGFLKARFRFQRTCTAVFVALLTTGAPLAVYANAGGFGTPKSMGPNFLFLTVDTLRANYTSVYGGPVQTPSLERLAARGTVFDHHHSLAPWTSPSVNGMYASKYPPSLTPNAGREKHKEQIGRYSISKDYWTGESRTTIVERFTNAGYRTAAFIGNPGIQNDRYLIDRFDDSRVVPGDMVRNHPSGPLAKTFLLRSAVERFWPGATPERPFDFTDFLRRKAQQFLRFHADGPFFLWIHFFDPHMPYDPPMEFRDDYKCGPFEFLPHGVGFNPEYVRHRDYIRSLYEGEIRYVDSSIGKVLDTLRDLDLEKNTYVTIWSDHGEEFWEHGKSGHGQSLYDDLTHVFLIFAGPDVRPGGRIGTATSSIDVMPTLADLFGLESIPGWRGVSLAKLLRGEPGEVLASPVYIQATGTVGSVEPRQAVVRGRLKLIRGMESGNLELYDFVADPAESQNLVVTNPDVARLLVEELQHWGTTFPVTFEQLGGTDDQSTPSAENMAVLEALGYL